MDSLARTVAFRLTESDYEQVLGAAESRGLRLGEFVRALVLQGHSSPEPLVRAGRQARLPFVVDVHAKSQAAFVALAITRAQPHVPASDVRGWCDELVGKLEATSGSDGSLEGYVRMVDSLLKGLVLNLTTLSPSTVANLLEEQGC